MIEIKIHKNLRIKKIEKLKNGEMQIEINIMKVSE
jgi:hypothetical protein